MVATPARLASSGAAKRVARPSIRISPRVRLIDAGDDLDQRRLARAVLAEQRVNLAGADVERDAAQRAHAGKALLEVAHLEQRIDRRRRRAHAASVACESGSTTTVRTPASASIASASGGRARVGDERMDALKRADDQAAARREFRRIGEHDEPVGALEELRFGAGDERIALDQAERTNRYRAHEHDPRRVVLDRVVVERRDDQLLVSIDFAAGQRNAVLGLVDQELRQRIGVGENLQPSGAQELRHLIGGRAAVDDDDVAVGAHVDRPAGDRALGCNVDRPGRIERTRGERRRRHGFRKGAVERLDAAVQTFGEPHVGEPDGVAPRRGR